MDRTLEFVHSSAIEGNLLSIMFQKVGRTLFVMSATIANYDYQIYYFGGA